MPTLLYRLGSDQALFFYIGRQLLEGQVPYRDGWDVKPPGIFAVYALANLVSRDFDLAPRLLELVATVWTGYLLILLCRRMGRDDAGPFAAFFFGALYYFEFNFWSTAQAEGFAAPLTVLGVICALDAKKRGPRAAVASGVCFGAVACLKTTLALYGAIPGVILLQSPARWTRIGTLIAGFLAVPAAFVVYFAAHGALGDLIDVFQVQWAYGRAQGFDWPGFRDVVFGLRGQYPYNFGGSMLALVGMLVVPVLRRSAFLWTWMAVFWIQVILQNKYFQYHFVPWVLPVAICLGVMTNELRSTFARIPRARLRSVAQLALGAILALAILRDPPYFTRAAKVAMGVLPREAYDRDVVFHVYRYVDSRQAAALVRSVTKPTDGILVYSFDSTIYLMSGRRSVSRYLSNTPIRTEEWFPERVRRRSFELLYLDVRAKPPAAFVTDFFWPWGIEPGQHGKNSLRFCGLDYDLVGVAGNLSVFRLSTRP